MSSNLDSNATHTYGAAGSYAVTITGEFPAISFYSTKDLPGNNEQLISVDRWGDGIWLNMDKAFYDCANLTAVPNTDGPVFAPNATLYAMFYECSSLNCDLNLWDLSNVREISEMFHGATSFNGDISDWDVSNVTGMISTFDNALVFNGDLSNWDVSKVERMDYLFSNASSFNTDISNWDVSSVLIMKGIFSSADVFNGDLSNWDVSKVTEMNGAFSNMDAFNRDISNWDVGNVKNMAGMFYASRAFNQPIGNWDVSKVTNMANMFEGATAFNQTLMNWDVSNVTNMNSMFLNAHAFNQQLGDWQIGQVVDMQRFLDGSGLSLANYEATLSGWATQSLQSGVFFSAEGLIYCSSTARQKLIEDGWQFSGDRNVCLVPAIPDGAGVVYVDSAVAVPGDGSSWASALKYLSNATASAASNVAIREVHVAKGSYFPTGDRNSLYVDSTFKLTRPDLKLLGGYPNGGGIRDIEANTTILSGDLGLPDDTADNTIMVLRISNIRRGTDSLIVDGFTLTGGNAIDRDNDPYTTLYAGVIDIVNSYESTVVRNCIFTGNFGGVVSALSIRGLESEIQDLSLAPAPQIQNCIFDNNVSIFEDPTFYSTLGSAVYIDFASPVITHCDFVNNRGIFGGALFNSHGAPIIYNSRFIGNSSMGVAVLLNVIYSHPVLINCTMLDNINTGFLGRVDLSPEVLKLTERAMIGNVYSSSCELINTTIANNKTMASLTGGEPLIFNLVESTTNITNSVIWGNMTKSLFDTAAIVPSKVTYSLMEGLAADATNHVLDGTLNVPIFVDSAAGNYQLRSTSAALNAGSNDSLLQSLAAYMPAITGGGLDLADSTRIREGVVDLGAYESLTASSLPVRLKYFTGVLQNGLARFEWASGLEEQLKTYVIEKSVDGKDFLPLVEVTPTGSNSQYFYSAVQSATMTYYRLKMVDMSGKTEYTAAMKLRRNAVAQGVQLYPNPATSYIHVRVRDVESASGSSRMDIYNAAGNMVKSVILKAGVNTIDISGLAAGIYYGLLVERNQKLPFVVK